MPKIQRAAAAGSLLLLIALLAGLLRYAGIDWAAAHFLHPDERFLAFVLRDASIPPSFSVYLDPNRSTLNPYLLGHDFFIYGTLPITLVKLLASALELDSFQTAYIVGRSLCAAADLGTLLLLFFSVLLVERREGLNPGLKYFAALFYALSALPIQQAHFFTVDSLMVFFLSLSVFGALSFFYSSTRSSLLLSGAAFGLALGTKVSALIALPLLLGLIAVIKRKEPIRLLISALAFLLAAYCILRLADPRLFHSADLLNASLNAQFLSNFETLMRASDPSLLYPPGIQWRDRLPILYPLQNIFFFGLGVPLSVLAVVGIMRVSASRAVSVWLIALWAAAAFLYLGTQPVASMRYFFPLYPVFAASAAAGLLFLLRRLRERYQQVGAGLIFLILTAFWPFAYLQVYLQEHPLERASAWIFDNVPNGSVIAIEHWDTTLPLRTYKPRSKQFQHEVLEVFAPPSEGKWKRIERQLRRADFLILASNRGYGSISRVPNTYPRMSLFYRDLFQGREPFRLRKEFRSDPKLFSISINDQWAEEAWTVYDHPRVLIFEKYED